MDGEHSDAIRALSNLTNGHAHLRQKRARSQLSCVPCRQGKLKCNRSHEPACDQCVKRSRESSCIYVPPPVKQKPAQNVKGRIRQLESLVVDLMNQQNNSRSSPTDFGRRSSQHTPPSSTQHEHNLPHSAPTPPSDNDSKPQISLISRRSGFEDGSNDEVEGVTKPFGQMRVSKTGVSYVGEAHWHAILNGIEDLKREVFDDEDSQDTDSDQPSEEAYTVPPAMNDVPPHCPLASGQVPMGGIQPYATTGLGFMIGHSKAMNKDQLIAAVPEKKIADRLLSLWFNSPDPFKPIIHAPTFQEEYRQYWRNPRQMPTMWLGLLFSIMSLATSFGLREIDPTSQQAKTILAEVNRYHMCAGAAAVLADYTKPRQYTIECLILYSAGLRSSNAFVNIWLMIGTVIRLCLRMGYHRDPGNYPAISVFHGEMRRRVWAIISMIDVLVSFQLGLPSLVKTVQSDTEMPRNLLDRDFNINTEVLPQNRSDKELTPCSYIRSKYRILRIFADATELSHATIPPSHEAMMELDRRLEDARAQIPPLLQMPDISEVVTDPAEQLMCRFNLDLIYLKTKTVLHRRYMERPFSQLTPEEQRSGIGSSRKTCVDCALRVLQHHHTIYTCTQPGGQLESVKWYMGSISTHDFLLASMVICLELSQQMNGEALPASMGNTPARRHAMLEALEKSQGIWAQASQRRQAALVVGKEELNKGDHMFDETERASRVMAEMLERVRTHQRANPGDTMFSNSSPAPFSTPSDRSPHSVTDGSVGMPESHTLQMNYMSTSNPSDPQTHIFGRPISYMPSWQDSAGLHTSSPFTTNGHIPGSVGPPLYGSDTYSHPTASSSNNPSPDHRSSSHPELDMITDVIDVQGPVDWGVWDDAVLKIQKQQWRAGGLSYEVDMADPTSTPDGSLGLASEPLIFVGSHQQQQQPVTDARHADDGATTGGGMDNRSFPVPAATNGHMNGNGHGHGLGFALPTGQEVDANTYQPWIHSFEAMDGCNMDRVLGFPKSGPGQGHTHGWVGDPRQQSLHGGHHQQHGQGLMGMNGSMQWVEGVE